MRFVRSRARTLRGGCRRRAPHTASRRRDAQFRFEADPNGTGFVVYSELVRILTAGLR